ncbi:MAG: HypC/HybG/HupF family hydrogenase formation chaperone [Sphingomonas sp.]|jgi:hydrogenase expression/formation protein HypC
MCLGIPGQIVEITDTTRKLGLAEVSGVRRQVNLACVLGGAPPEALLGAWVLIHVGFAMSRIDEDQAAETLRILTELGDAQEELAAMRASESALTTSRHAAALGADQ